MAAQILEPATWHCKLSKQEIDQGDVIDLVFEIGLDDTWLLYSNIQNYELGPLPAVFEFETNQDYELINDIIPVGFKTKYDDVFEVNVNYFDGKAEFRQKVKILSKNAIIKGYYEYQVCSMINGKCIMGEDDFEFNIETTNL